MEMDIVIIEDEQLSADRLVKMLGESVPGAEVVSVLHSVKEGLEFFGRGPAADLVLADISLLDGLCFSIFDCCDVAIPVIFLTAYDEYALQAFRYNSIAYLMKPVRKEDLVKAVIKYRIHGNVLSPETRSIIRAIGEGKLKWRERILLQSGEEYFPVPVGEVSFFVYDFGVTKAVMKDGSMGLCDISLDHLEEQLDPSRFLRLTRQHIIDIEDVKSLKRIDSKHFLVRMKSSAQEIASTNSRCNRLKVMLDR